LFHQAHSTLPVLFFLTPPLLPSLISKPPLLQASTSVRLYQLSFYLIFCLSLPVVRPAHAALFQSVNEEEFYLLWFRDRTFSLSTQINLDWLHQSFSILQEKQSLLLLQVTLRLARLGALSFLKAKAAWGLDRSKTFASYFY